MTNKECFLVTAYCNTEEKKQVLQKTLNDLKRYNKEIILYSHYPITEEESNLTNYAVYDYSNPIVDIHQGSMLHWVMVENFRLCTLYPDYGYAAVQQWKRGLLYANMLGFKKVYVLNYDLDINDQLVYLLEKGLEQHKSVLLDYDLPQQNPGMHMSLAGIQTQYFLELLNQINYLDYLSTHHDNIPENYLFNKFNSDNTMVVPVGEWENIATTSIRMGEQSFVEEFYTRNGYKWILGQEKIFDKGVESNPDKVVLCLWDVEDNLEVEIFIDGKGIPLKDIKKTDRTIQIYLPIPYSQITQYVGKFVNNTFEYVEGRLKIIINGVEIEKELLRLCTISAIENINE